MQKACFFILFAFSFLLGNSSTRDNNPPPEDVYKSFNGILIYYEYTPFDTTLYEVYVTKNKIRVDSYNGLEKKGDPNKIVIYNLKDQKILALKPSALIYKYINSNANYEPCSEGCEILIDKNIYKYITGIKCKQYRVRNKAENTDITYWVPEEKYTFYSQMMAMKHSIKRPHKYFFKLPNHEYVFPMQTVERTLLREEKSSFKVIHFEESTIVDNIFEIPEGYNLSN